MLQTGKRKTGLLLTLLWALGAIAACSGAQGDSGTTVENTQPTDEPPPAGELTGEVLRSRLQDMLGQSVGDFLRRVQVEVETNESGGYLGWRLTALPETSPSWLDVRAGDVVVTVNGMSLEQPDDAQRAWEILQVSSEIRLDLIRDGEERVVRVPVVDDAASEEPREEPTEDERRGPEQ